MEKADAPRQAVPRSLVNERDAGGLEPAEAGAPVLGLEAEVVKPLAALFQEPGHARPARSGSMSSISLLARRLLDEPNFDESRRRVTLAAWHERSEECGVV
jgi:hypothetical protein